MKNVELTKGTLETLTFLNVFFIYFWRASFELNAWADHPNETDDVTTRLGKLGRTPGNTGDL